MRLTPKNRPRCRHTARRWPEAGASRLGRAVAVPTTAVDAASLSRPHSASPYYRGCHLGSPPGSQRGLAYSSRTDSLDPLRLLHDLHRLVNSSSL